MKRFLKTIALVLALAALPMMALADDDFGSAAVTEGETYTVEQMLTYAMQDEYMAKAEYDALQAAFGVTNPYANIARAELTHQAELLTLFEAYGIAVPANTAAGNVVIPATLQEAYEIGVQAEVFNIDMYQAFLAQSDVPQDVRDVFTELIKASQSHLAAFTRNAEKTGLGLGNGMETGRGRALTETQPAGYGLANNQAAANSYSQTVGMGNRGVQNNTQTVNTTAAYGRGNMQTTTTASYGRNNKVQAPAVQTTGMGHRSQTVSNNQNCDDCDSCTVSQTTQPSGGRNRR